MLYNGCDVFHVTVVPDMVYKSDGNGNLVVFDEQNEGLNLIITPVRPAVRNNKLIRHTSAKTYIS